jgi:hypothetical protein
MVTEAFICTCSFFSLCWFSLIVLQQRRRNDFSREEVTYLLNGVKKFGFSWNSILWSYPFQPGRTNVNLAKKYRQLMVKAT